MKLRFSLYFLFCFAMGLAQVKDTIPPATQRYLVGNGKIYVYQKPKFREIFINIPKDLCDLGRFVIQKENLKWDAIAVGSTLALLPADQHIVDESVRIGQQIGGWDEPSRYTRIFGIEMIPTSISSAVYYIGTGNTTLLISGIFYAAGKIGPDDYRALHTSSELVEVLLSVGITTQTIKRITGRESPIAATKSGGDWTPFPSFKAFATNTPSYDAMPSGHVATYMATITVIAENYPEVKWLKPVGYSLGGILAFNMLSGKVHWASDYPLAVLAGYVIGKKAAGRRITKISTETGYKSKPFRYETRYSYNRRGNLNVMGITVTF